jgi:hypothetical protein
MKRLIVDIPNLFWRVVSAHNAKYEGTAEDKAGLALHSCLTTFNKWFKVVNPDQIAVVFEGSNNWRKTYTASDQCISKVLYKGNRVKDPSMAHLFDVLNDFKTLIEQHTSIICLQNDLVEGDDLIAAFVQEYSGDEIVILSGDKDFKQLLSHKNVTLLNPDDGKPRTVEDPIYFLFEKCIRGDVGDNVLSAFRRVRATRLQKAFTDEFEYANIMNHEFTRPNPVTLEEQTFKVGDLFKENKLLMDLEAQPEDIRKSMKETIQYQSNNFGKFNNFAFQKFLGQHNLVNIGDNSSQYVNLFTRNSTPIKKSVIEF